MDPRGTDGGSQSFNVYHYGRKCDGDGQAAHQYPTCYINARAPGGSFHIIITAKWGTIDNSGSVCVGGGGDIWGLAPQEKNVYISPHLYLRSNSGYLLWILHLGSVHYLSCGGAGQWREGGRTFSPCPRGGS